MKNKKNILLRDLTTMRLGGMVSDYFAVKTVDDIKKALSYAKFKKLPFFVIGGGSNLIASDENLKAVLIHIQIPGIEILESSNKQKVIFRVGAGVDWDEFVKISVEKNLSGIEALSSIPGLVGASPVQNIGAYGQEVKDTILGVEVYDTKKDEVINISNKDCRFGYRDSIFRNAEIGRYIILYVNFALSKEKPKPPFYKALQDYLDAHNITDYSVKNIRESVMQIRKDKLPDPKIVANSGSFFKNAICSKSKLDELKKTYPDIPYFNHEGNQFKIPTGWLIEQCGLKGKEFFGFKIHDKNALVLINQKNASYKDLASVRDIVISSVKNKFGIVIEQEPLEITTK